MTNFRQLCEDLVNSWDVDGCDWRPQHQARWEATVERARNALAESEPEGPTDEELLRTYGLAKRDHNYEGPIDDWLKRAERAATVAGLRAAIAADRAQRQPEPGEVQELVEWLLEEADDYDCIGETLRSLKCRRAAELLSQRHPPLVAIPGEEYHEDMGSVTWWRLPVEEPPWVGTPNDSDWPGYHTHFTPAPPEPLNANGLPLRGGRGMSTIARAERYAGQDFPCYGSQPVVWGLATVFNPWFFDGKVVRWGPPCETRSDAVAAAAEMASLATRAGTG